MSNAVVSYGSKGHCVTVALRRPSAMRGSDLPAGPSVSTESQTIEGARLMAGFRILSGWSAMQALENVRAAGIYVLEYAYQPGSHTRGNDESE